jgi:hypothetical protein
VLICGECSAHNADDESFCDSCGAFLGWQAQGEEGGKKPSTAGSPRGPRTFPQTVTLPQIPVPSGGAGNDHREPPIGRSRAADSDSSSVGGAERTAHGQVASGQRTAPTGAGTTVPVPMTDDEPAPVRPGGRIVGAPRERRRYDGVSPDAGPLVCATCGTGNKEDRNFCRRCAASLRAPEPEVHTDQRLSRWARLFGRPSQKALPAGTRPLWKSRRFPARLVAFLAVLGLAGGVASANRDAISSAPQRILDEIINDHKEPAATEASATTDGRKATLATDGRHDTFWATNLISGERNNFLEVKFPREIRLVYVFITGQPSKPIPASGERQPSKVLISVHHKGAKDRFHQEIYPEIELPNDGKRHGFYVGADSVESVRLTIVEPKYSATKTIMVSLAEVQFTGR